MPDGMPPDMFLILQMPTDQVLTRELLFSPCAVSHSLGRAAADGRSRKPSRVIFRIETWDARVTTEAVSVVQASRQSL